MMRRDQSPFGLLETSKPLKDLSQRLLHAIQIDEDFEVTSILKSNKELAKEIILTTVYIQNFGDGTSLHAAAYHGHTSIVRHFIKLGIDVNTKDSRNRTALHAAAVRGLVNMVSYLLKEHICIDERDRWGQTALHKACIYGYTEVAMVLLKKGAHPESTDNSGRTPLDIAQLMDHATTADLLNHVIKRTSDA